MIDKLRFDENEDFYFKRFTEQTIVITLEEDEFGKEAEEIYLPKSICNYDMDNGELEVPEWLAKEKGMI